MSTDSSHKESALVRIGLEHLNEATTRREMQMVINDFNNSRPSGNERRRFLRESRTRLLSWSFNEKV